LSDLTQMERYKSYLRTYLFDRIIETPEQIFSLADMAKDINAQPDEVANAVYALVNEHYISTIILATGGFKVILRDNRQGGAVGT